MIDRGIDARGAGAPLPCLDIVMVTRNCVAAARRTLRSLRQQTHTGWRLVAIDGASTDGTREALLADARDGDVVSSEADDGIYDAMNRALRALGDDAGRLCLFMNAGDTFSCESSLSCAMQRMGGNEADIYVFPWEVDGVIFQPNPGAMFALPGCHQAMFYRCSLLRRHPFQLRYRLCADYRQYLDLLEAGARVAYFPGMAIAHYDSSGMSSRAAYRVIYEHCQINFDRQGLALTLAWAVKRVFRTVFRRALDRA